MACGSADNDGCDGIRRTLGHRNPQDPNLAPPQFWIHAEAEYSIDGVAMKQAGPSGINFLQNGMRHVWNLDPVPSDAKELTFRITKLGDWQGAWEFNVALQ